MSLPFGRTNSFYAASKNNNSVSIERVLEVGSCANTSNSDKKIETANNLNQKKAISQNPVNTFLLDYGWKLLVIWHAVNSQAPVEGFKPKLRTVIQT